jgi:hypothetical protein
VSQSVRIISWQVSNNGQILPTKSVLYSELMKVGNEVEKSDSFVLSDVLLTVPPREGNLRTDLVKEFI